MRYEVRIYSIQGLKTHEFAFRFFASLFAELKFRNENNVYKSQVFDNKNKCILEEWI